MSALTDGLDRIFRAQKGDFEGRITSLADAVEAISAGLLDDALRASAERDAHKLVGSLGTFGLHRGSELARELETTLAPGRPPVGAGNGPHLSQCVAALRDILDDEFARLGCGDDAGAAKPIDPSACETETETGVERTPVDAVAGVSILVVDDDAAVRDVLVEMLAEAGYQASGVGSAREARYALVQGDIPLLLSDVNMPGETGLDLVRYALCEHPETATLLISALEDPAIAQIAIDYGAYGYLTKPVRRSAVLIGVMTALRRRDVEARERIARRALEQNLQLRSSALTTATASLERAAAQGRVLQAETIHRWARSAEYRDPGIGLHLGRVGHYCALLGDRLGLHAESLQLASALHDVGKVAIPDSILLKPGPLTTAERHIIETHPTVGWEMLHGSSGRLLDLAAMIAKTHHEKFDGSGYPGGLAGTNIPLEGRIAAVADVFDALTSDRAYRPALSLEATIAWMEGESGRHFDPAVLAAFVSAMDEIQSVRSLLSQ